MSQCDAFGLLPAEAAAEVVGVIGIVTIWQAHFAEVGVSASDIESLAERIDGGELMKQRSLFDPARFQATPVRKRSASSTPKEGANRRSNTLCCARAASGRRYRPRALAGNASAGHKRFLGREKAGFFEAVWRAGLAEHDEMEGIAWCWPSIEGEMITPCWPRRKSV